MVGSQLKNRALDVVDLTQLHAAQRAKELSAGRCESDVTDSHPKTRKSIERLELSITSTREPRDHVCLRSSHPLQQCNRACPHDIRQTEALLAFGLNRSKDFPGK